MISPLADKPPIVPLEDWFAQVEASANLCRETARTRFVLNGMPALKARYLNTTIQGGVEMEEVYVVSGFHTFSIEFSGEKSGPLEELTNFPIYTKMAESFKVQDVAPSARR